MWYLQSPLDLRDKRVLVVGLGRSGLAAAKLCLTQGAQVTVTDNRAAKTLEPALTQLPATVTRSLGGHPQKDFDQADLIVVSPGVPPLKPILAAKKRGLPVIGEVELSARFVKAPIVAITGTNGKSTTTSLIGEMLKRSGRAVFIGGNLGQPLAEVVGGPETQSEGCVVLELSSFQLETVMTLRAHVACLLNLSEDHLDRYDSYEAYLAAKARIFERQEPGDFVVLNGAPSQTACWQLAEESPATKLYFAPDRPPPKIASDADSEDAASAMDLAAYRAGGALQLKLPGRPEESYPLPKLAGRHNVENALAALVAARLMGASAKACCDTLREFGGLPHRMEWVAEIEGVNYYNDSKATNVGSVVGSLSGFPQKVVLIAGGKDKGGDYQPLVPVVRENCAALILIGAATEIMADALADTVPIHRATSMGHAVEIAAQISRVGQAVVLSPACSSYDMFNNFEERGQVFCREVEGRRISP